MEHKQAMARQPIEKERLIIALDVETTAEARGIVGELKEHVGAFKIGLQLFTAGGPSFVSEIVRAGIKVFLDVKFHDIPNTVAKASVEVARLGVWMFNIHALGGREMMRRAAGDVSDICEKEGLERPKIMGVTILTSADRGTLGEVGLAGEIDSQVLNLAKLAAECGLDGVVASPREVKTIRENIDDPGFLIVTPGIRPDFATNDDQKRVMPPGEAVSAGSDYLVIGRPVLRAGDRPGAVRKVLGEI
jgi:orotidine-5'-phosphate decarboxylase